MSQRIAARQTGVVASLEKLTVSHLSTLVDQVLNNSMYRDNARKYQRAIAETNGLSRAARLLEEAFGLAQERQLIHFNRGQSNGQWNRKRATGI